MGPKQIITFLCLSSFVLAHTTQGAQPQTGFTIPEKPTSPPQFTIKAPADAFHCERYFIYQGEKINCDSIMRQDGERLRPIVHEIPEAVAELDTYQKNRRKVRSAAYIGSIGILMIVAGSLLSRRSNASSSSKTIADIAQYGGIGLTGGTLLYGLATLRSNESHLGKTVQIYNDRHPERPIELQFTTDFNL